MALGQSMLGGGKSRLYPITPRGDETCCSLLLLSHSLPPPPLPDSPSLPSAHNLFPFSPPTLLWFIPPIIKCHIPLTPLHPVAPSDWRHHLLPYPLTLFPLARSLCPSHDMLDGGNYRFLSLSFSLVLFSPRLN